MTTASPAGVLRRWWPECALLAGFVALTAALASGAFLDLDYAVRDWWAAHLTRPVELAALGLNRLGQGGALTGLAAALAVLAAWRLGTVRPLLLVVFGFVLTTGVVLPLKHWTDRAAPRSALPDAAELFNALPPGEYGESYPSGHVVVAIVWYGIILLLISTVLRSFGRRPVPPGVGQLVRAVPPVVVFGTTTVLGYHWLTDGVAAVLLGLLLDRAVSRTPWCRTGLLARPCRPAEPVAATERIERSDGREGTAEEMPP